MNTTENNKLIAEFIGVVFHDDENKYYDIDGLYIGEMLEYHTSWDYLMPVVNKIRSLYNNTEVMHSDIIDDLAEGCIEANILQVYDAVVNFIKDFNAIEKLNSHPDSDIKVVNSEESRFVWLTVTEKAKEVYSSDLFTLFVLYNDGSESQVESMEELIKALENGLDIGIEVGHIEKLKK